MARRVPVVAPALLGLATFMRMTPPLLLMYVVFFGVGYYVATVTAGRSMPSPSRSSASAYAGAANLGAFLEAWEVLRRARARTGGRLRASPMRR